MNHLTLPLALPLAGAECPRLAVLTDIGGDPDDQQSLVRLMVYANEFEIEVFIATAAGTRGELKQSVTRPGLIREIVEAYGQVRPNLARPPSQSPNGRWSCWWSWGRSYRPESAILSIAYSGRLSSHSSCL
jgi:hypothetical protein